MELPSSLDIPPPAQSPPPFSSSSSSSDALLLPLIPPPSPDDEVEVVPVAKQVSSWSLVGQIGALSWPVVVAYLLEMMVPVVSLTVLGHVGTDVLGGAALATMFANVTGVSTCFGLATALDTLASQAVGAGRENAVGLQAQRGAAILLLTAALVTGSLWLNAGPILVALHQDPHVAHIAQTYIRCLIPMLPALCILEVQKKVAYALQVVRPQLVILLVVNSINAGLQVAAVHGLGLHYLAVPILTSASAWVSVAIFGAYMARDPVFARVWTGWHLRAAFQQWPSFLRLGLPGLLMLTMEWWAFELLALEAGLLGTEALAAQVIVLNIASLLFMIPLGQSVAVSTLVGNFLGAGNPRTAKRCAFLALACVCGTAMCTALLLILTRSHLALAYTSDPVIIRLVSRALIVVAVFQIFDGVQAVCSGTLRGVGRQSLGAVGNFFGYILIGVPLGALLAFKADASVEGLWIGMTLGLFLTSSTYTIVLSLQNWPHYSRLAVSRAHAQTIITHPDSDSTNIDADIDADIDTNTNIDTNTDNPLISLLSDFDP